MLSPSPLGCCTPTPHGRQPSYHERSLPVLAAVLEGLNQFTVQEVPLPKVEPDTLLIRVRACAVLVNVNVC